MRILFVLIALLSSLFAGCIGDPIPAVSPEEQLRDQIGKLEDSIDGQEFMVQDALIETKQFQDNRKYELLRARNLAKLLNESGTAAARTRSKELKEEFEILREMYDFERKYLQDLRSELEQKRKELERISQSSSPQSPVIVELDETTAQILGADQLEFPAGASDEGISNVIEYLIKEAQAEEVK